MNAKIQRIVTQAPQQEIKVTVRIDGKQSGQVYVNRELDSPCDTLQTLIAQQVRLPPLYNVNLLGVTSNMAVEITQDDLQDPYSQIVNAKTNEMYMDITTSKDPKTALSEFFREQIKTEVDVAPELQANQSYYNGQLVTVEDGGETVIYFVKKLYLRLVLHKKDAQNNKFLVKKHEVKDFFKHSGISVAFLLNVQEIIIYWNKEKATKVQIDQA